MTTTLAGPTVLFSALAFMAVLGPLVFFHELGHYLVGRWCGIRADAFSIGFGREVLGWTDKRGTRWKVGWLPLGGYVQFAGDSDAASTPQAVETHAPGTFGAASLGRRALTVAAGPVANFLIAFLIITAFVMAVGKPGTPPVVASVMQGSPAATAGLLAGDRVAAIDGRTMDSFSDIPMTVMHRPGEALRLTVERAGATREVVLRPRLVAERDQFGNRIERAIIGIGSGPQVITPVGLLEAPGVAISQCWGIVRQMGEVLAQLVTGNRSIRDLGGPLQIAKVSGEQATLGLAPFIFFVALISINLGLVNLLPLPMLDGGHLMFFAAEAVRRRPVGLASQQWAFRFGFALIALLMIVVTFNDLSSIGVWQRIAGLIG